MPPAEFDVRAHWWRTGDPYFPMITTVGGTYWVLRINSFPDHPLYTLFVDGARRYDLDDVPPTWRMPAGDPASPVRTGAESGEQAVRAALAPVRDFVAYGSEVGQPCDNPYCCG